jgi:hypothetical protein
MIGGVLTRLSQPFVVDVEPRESLKASVVSRSGRPLDVPYEAVAIRNDASFGLTEAAYRKMRKYLPGATENHEAIVKDVLYNMVEYAPNLFVDLERGKLRGEDLAQFIVGAVQRRLHLTIPDGNSGVSSQAKAINTEARYPAGFVSQFDFLQAAFPEQDTSLQKSALFAAATITSMTRDYNGQNTRHYKLEPEFMRASRDAGAYVFWHLNRETLCQELRIEAQWAALVDVLLDGTAKLAGALALDEGAKLTDYLPLVRRVLDVTNWSDTEAFAFLRAFHRSDIAGLPPFVVEKVFSAQEKIDQAVREALGDTLEEKLTAVQETRSRSILTAAGLNAKTIDGLGNTERDMLAQLIRMAALDVTSFTEGKLERVPLRKRRHLFSKQVDETTRRKLERLGQLRMHGTNMAKMVADLGQNQSIEEIVELLYGAIFGADKEWPDRVIVDASYPNVEGAKIPNLNPMRYVVEVGDQRILVVWMYAEAEPPTEEEHQATLRRYLENIEHPDGRVMGQLQKIANTEGLLAAARAVHDIRAESPIGAVMEALGVPHLSELVRTREPEERIIESRTIPLGKKNSVELPALLPSRYDPLVNSHKDALFAVALAIDEIIERRGALVTGIITVAKGNLRLKNTQRALKLFGSVSGHDVDKVSAILEANTAIQELTAPDGENKILPSVDLYNEFLVEASDELKALRVSLGAHGNDDEARAAEVNQFLKRFAARHDQLTRAWRKVNHPALDLGSMLARRWDLSTLNGALSALGTAKSIGLAAESQLKYNDTVGKARAIVVRNRIFLSLAFGGLVALGGWLAVEHLANLGGWQSYLAPAAGGASTWFAAKFAKPGDFTAAKSDIVLRRLLASDFLRSAMCGGRETALALSA